MRTEEAPDLDMIYIMKGSFSEDFKNNSLVGYYDKLSPTLFIRRDLSTPDYQKVNLNSHAGGVQLIHSVIIYHALCSLECMQSIKRHSFPKNRFYDLCFLKRQPASVEVIFYKFDYYIFSGFLLQTARKMVYWTGGRIS